MTIYFLILFGTYFVLLLALRVGWSRAIGRKEMKLVGKDFFISVIIPVRNERNNVGKLLSSLSSQNYPAANFEVIMVDDHSDDGEIEKYKGPLQNLAIHYLGEDENGKKAALNYGINMANGEVIATTDADCLLPSDWLETINSVFQENKVNMAAGMVTIADEKKFFSRWQAMEFSSVMGTGAALFGLNNPVMCNGANLSFRKKAFQQVKGYEGNEHIASGDDEFLMRKIQDLFPNSIRIINSTVITRPQTTLKEFIFQRIRWASKWRRNPSVSARVLAVFILLIQLSWVILFLQISIDSNKVLLGIFASKLIADLLFLVPVFGFMKVKFRLTPFLGLQFLYPFYVIFVGLLAPWKSYQWKERKIL